MTTHWKTEKGLELEAPNTHWRLGSHKEAPTEGSVYGVLASSSPHWVVKTLRRWDCADWIRRAPGERSREVRCWAKTRKSKWKPVRTNPVSFHPALENQQSERYQRIILRRNGTNQRKYLQILTGNNKAVGPPVVMQWNLPVDSLHPGIQNFQNLQSVFPNQLPISFFFNKKGHLQIITHLRKAFNIKKKNQNELTEWIQRE